MTGNLDPGTVCIDGPICRCRRFRKPMGNPDDGHSSWLIVLVKTHWSGIRGTVHDIMRQSRSRSVVSHAFQVHTTFWKPLHMQYRMPVVCSALCPALQNYKNYLTGFWCIPSTLILYSLYTAIYKLALLAFSCICVPPTTIFLSLSLAPSSCELQKKYSVKSRPTRSSPPHQVEKRTPLAWTWLLRA